VVAWNGRPTPVWTDIRNGNQDVFAAYPDLSVPVLFQRLEARRLGGTVHLEWDISTGETLEGFHVYRKEGLDGVELRVNREGLLPISERSFDDVDALPNRAYDYALGVVRSDGSELRSSPVNVGATLARFIQKPGFPNPFNPVTTLRYSIPEAGRVVLGVYDVRGRLVATLVDKRELAGDHVVRWNARDADGSTVASGTYFVRLQWGGRTQTRKITLAK
jgi:hypothetical protein